MPKVRASMADVSTEYVPAEPDTYTLKVTEVKINTRREVFEGNEVERETHIIKSVIQDEGDAQNKPVYDYIDVTKKDGTPNDYGLADLKRYFEAIAPEYANDEEPDTDVLLHGLFMAEVVIEEYEKKPEKGGGIGRSNKLNRRSITAV